MTKVTPMAVSPPTTTLAHDPGYRCSAEHGPDVPKHRQSQGHHGDHDDHPQPLECERVEREESAVMSCGERFLLSNMEMSVARLELAELWLAMRESLRFPLLWSFQNI
jgi:hypothetical protein